MVDENFSLFFPFLFKRLIGNKDNRFYLVCRYGAEIAKARKIIIRDENDEKPEVDKIFKLYTSE